ncbi:MAG: TRAP transporter substrate-binding protein [Synergistaceae bacterium]|jgi:TRAP-type C4-dicarboxylate transport system substrate-binding protein|nr:TRAP transporter substrate-binding protein [Synergistaceae bacterium]
MTIILFSCLVPAAQAKTTLTALTVWNEDNYQTRGLLLMAKRVAELSKGELELRVEFGGTLGYKGGELLRAVGDGQLDIAEMVASNVAGDAPVLGLRTLPMMIESWDDVALFDKLAKPYYEAACKTMNQRVLVISPWPFGSLWSTKEIKKVSDMKGLKMRSYDRNGALFAAAVGAQGLNIPFAEVYTSLATGLIDSMITSSVTVSEAKVYEVCKYQMPIGFATATSITTINEASWAKLTPEQKEALTAASAESQAFLWDEVRKVSDAGDQQCYDNGVALVPVSDAFHNELVEIGKSVARDWLDKNKTAKDAIALYDEFMAARKK